MTEQHGQKRKEIGEPEDLPDPKRRKIDQKTSDQSKENFELSEDEENLDYHIEDLLAPQEKDFLRQDPFNLNFLATTWTNETTSLKTRSKFKKWIGDWPHTADLAPELLLSIINFCEVDTAFKWRRVSKLTNSLVITSDYLWRTHFYARHWKLRHDLENRFMGVDPKDEDKTNWIHVIPDNDIDWFSEYIRNHINAMSIQKLIKDITNKLQKMVDEHFVVREGYKIYQPGHERLAFFQNGLTDEEIDDRFSSYFLHSISNDLRELFKCCNGARFNMSNREKIFDVDVLPVVFPELRCITKGITYARFEKIDGGGLYSSDSEISEDDWDFDREPLDLSLNPEIPEQPSKIEISASDMASDGYDYEMSDQSESSSEDEEDDISDDDSYERLSKDWGVFGAHTEMLKFMGEQIVEGDPPVEQLYNMSDGALFLVNEEHYMGLHEMDFTAHSSIVEYLQDISDLLDDPSAFLWVKFYAYELKDQTTDDQSDENLDENDGGNLDSSEKAEEDEQSIDHLHEVLDFYIHDHYVHNYIAPRAVKLAVAAGQDFAVKVFKHARNLDGCEELQPGTFTRAAKELFPKEIFDEAPPRERRRKT